MTPILGLTAFANLVPAAFATDVQFEGSYRARGRAFDTLSLDRSVAVSEGLTAFGQHRLWLKPTFIVNDSVKLMVEFRGLDGALWGGGAPQNVAPDGSVPLSFDQPSPATVPSVIEDFFRDFTVWRAWGQVDTTIGRFHFGRMPLHWGAGIWFNDGLSTHPNFADYGDTSDRIQWQKLMDDRFFLQLGVDVPAEGLPSLEDDTTAFDLAVAYRSETVTAGLMTRLDHTGRRSDDVDSLNLFVLDGAFDAEMGRLHVEAEVVARFGGGDLDSDIDEVSIAAGGAVLHASYELTDQRLHLAVEGGFATGDAQPDDKSLRTFSFDRDYSPGLMMFEQPMPVFATSFATSPADARDYSAIASFNAVSNAVFVKPTVTYRLHDDWRAHASWLGARVARGLRIDADEVRGGTYGNEFHLGMAFAGVQHWNLSAIAGVFLPGTVFSVDRLDLTNTGFDDAVYGLQVTSEIRF